MIFHVLPFGKHKGKCLDDVPRDYLAWLSTQVWLRDKYPLLAAAVLQRLNDGSDDAPTTSLTTDVLKTWRQRMLRRWHPDADGGSHQAFVAVTDAIDSLINVLKGVSA